jgi:uncharacterized protein (UPF0179 family)
MTPRYSLVAGPENAAVDPVSGVFTWQPNEAQGPGVFSVTVQVTDNGMPPRSDSKTFSVAVNEVNSAPWLAAIPDQTVAAGVTLSLQLSAIDADLPANALAYRLIAGPAGAAVDPVSGVFSWRPSASQGGAFPVTVQVTDNSISPLSDSKSFSIVVQNVNSAPVLAAIPDQVIAEGNRLNVQLSATDADLPANALTYQLLAGPAGAAVDPVSGLFCWTPTEAQGPGSLIVTVQVADNGISPLSDTKTFSVVVNEANSAPVLAAIPNQTVAEGSKLNVQLSATDADLPTNALTYQLLAGPPGATAPSGGLFSWTPTEAAGPGKFTVTVQVTDNGSPARSDSRTFSVDVTEVNRAPVLAVIPDQIIAEGSTLTLQLSATDFDIPANPLAYQLILGPAGATVDPNGLFSWTPSESQGPGTFAVTVQVTDSGTPALYHQKTFTVAVTEVNAPPVLSPVPDQEANAGQVLTVSVQGSDPDLPANKLTYRMVSGPDGAEVDANTGVFTWRLSKSQSSASVQVVVSVTDDASQALSDTQSFYVRISGKGNNNKSAQNAARLAGPGFLRWAADVSGSLSVEFIQPAPAGMLSGHWKHSLETSEDLVTWVNVGPLSETGQVHDSGAQSKPMRFYRVRSQEIPAGAAD